MAASNAGALLTAQVPEPSVDLATLVGQVREIYDRRNSPPFVWADDPSVETSPLVLSDDDD